VISPAELRTQLAAMLPQYMVPGAYVVLNEFPLTTNGKLDRKALPAPAEGSRVLRQYVAPDGEVEQAIAQIWQQLLKVERVGRQDNFFELGGHSLLIVQMLERLRRVGLSTQVRRVFDSASLQELAGVVDQIHRAKDSEHCPVIVVGNKTDLTQHRRVSEVDGRQFAKSANALFIETSAKVRVNIDEAFAAIVREIRRQVQYNGYLTLAQKENGGVGGSNGAGGGAGGMGGGPMMGGGSAPSRNRSCCLIFVTAN